MNYQVAQPKLIYIFGIEDAAHQGLLKIGETTLKNLPPTEKNLRQAAHERIDTYTRTAGIAYKLFHTELAVTDNGKAFRDYDVHNVLINSNVKKEPPPDTNAREWFKVELPVAIQAIAAVKQGRQNLSGMSVDKIIPVTFRPEQQAAIDKTVNCFKRGGKKFLWNAKMRFGKTICALEVVRQMNFAKTIIVTHRPVVNEGWYKDFTRKIFHDSPNFIYGKDFAPLTAGGKHFVYFASIQDLRGSQIVGGKFDKNVEVFDTPWDCVIVDEAHEGTKTVLGDAVIKKLVQKKTKLLALSGTPFNIIDSYDPDSVYTWDYVMEQRAKADWAAQHGDDSNPYDELPQMNIYTYNLGELLGKSFAGKEDSDDDDIVFSFKEFFKVDGERFVHEDDVQSFLNLLVKPDASNYPYSRPEFCNMFRHTLWIIPGVKEAKALSALLKNHQVFCNFEVVNVAGDGDEDDTSSDDALTKVRNAIDTNDYTITLSCGRLTTGVTVPEWSAVFYLAGGYSTSAMSYLQTIFRVQTPCNIGGVSKRNGYVFDFAPDRALKMITESVKVSARAGKTDDGGRQRLGDMLKFCPVIAVEGSRMKQLDAKKLLQRIKRAQADRIARNGFDDSNLYNDKLLNLTGLDLDKFKALKKIVGASKTKVKDIPINDQGLTGTTDGNTGTGKTRIDEQKELEKRKRLRRDAIAILRGVSIRMPLLIYGAEVDFDEDITIDQFARIVDDASWEEFMPKGVTKDLFAEFVKYYDPDTFIEAGRRIRERAKATDALKPAERVQAVAALFATFKNPDNETVLTPWRVVEIHLDALSPALFAPDKKILDINAKTGLYPLSVAYRIYRARLGNVDEAQEDLDTLRRLWDMTVAHNVFVLCKTPMAVTITRRTLLGYRAGSVNARHFKDLIPTLKLTPTRFLDRITDKDFWSKGVGKMFFDGVVGNPPYQVSGTGDNKNFASPVYNRFLDAAYNERLTKHASLIHPARCLFNAGATPQDFRNKFLNNPHVRIVRHEIDGKAFFPTSDIKGGVVITEFDATQTFEPIGLFIPFDELKTIHDKVWRDNPRSLSEGMFGTDIYHWREQIHIENPTLVKRMSKGHEYDISTNAFELLPEIFLDAHPDDGKEYVQMIGRAKNQRVIKWVRRDYLREHPTFYNWKALVPASNGSGALGEVLVTPLVGSPLVGHTSTFIVVGAFDSEAEARACIAYIKSKFCRVMLGILKVTQHNPPQTWSKVPMQDFNPATSKINWNVSIREIDAQLYRKYGLTAEEIKFIETNVKEMT